MSGHCDVILLLKISFLVAATRALTNCPSQCVCEDNSIVCSCESTQFSKLVISSLGGTYVSSFTVHSCATVFVANDSFAGVVLSDRLEFFGIGRLTFEPYAFRNILQSPKQLVIDKCSLPVILPHTFTGLSHMEHLWFRNSTIGKLSTHAFHHLTHVTYLYFRDVTFKRIEKKAFGKMYSIGHLFLGGSISIETSDGFLLAASSVEEVLLEGAVGQLDEAFLLDAFVQLATIRNSDLRMDSHGDDAMLSHPLIHPTTSHETSLHILNVTMSSLVPRLLTHFRKITISNCSIGRIRQNRRFTIPLHDTSLSFTQTNIGMVDSYAFANISARTLRFAGCVVGKMKRFAAMNSRFHYILIEDSRIASIDEGLLRNSHVKSLLIKTSEITQLLPMTFQRSFVNSLKIVLSEIGSLDIHALRGTRIGALTLDKAGVNRVKGKPFLFAEINTLHIVDCKLHSTPAREFFSGLTATRLSVINTTFNCDPNDCEMNSLLLKPSRHDLLWKFHGNSCNGSTTLATNDELFCDHPTVLHQSGLICRRSWAITDCVCAGSSASLPDLNASVVVIGDCEHLTIRSVGATTQALYLFRIGRCDVVRMPIMTKTLKIYHSNLAIHSKAFLNNHISIMALSHAIVYRVEPQAFVNVTIEEMTISNSSLASWHAETVETSRFANVSILGSRIGMVTPLLGAIRDVSIRNSILSTSKGLSAIRVVHLSNNTVLCCCDNPTSTCGSDISMKQKCGEYSKIFICDVSEYTDNPRIPLFLLTMSFYMINQVC